MKGHRPVAFGALVAILVTSAGIAATTSNGGHNATFTLAYVPPVIANPIIKAGNDAMAIQAKSLGMKFSTVGGQYDPQAQIVAVNAVLQRKFDALAIWPLDPKSIKPSLAKARKAGLPVFVQDSPSSVPPANINFALDDYDATYKLGLYAAAQIKAAGKPCKVGIMLATMAQPAIDYGATIAWSANQTLLHKRLPKTIWNYHKFVSQANVSKYVTLENRLKQGPWNVRIVIQKGRSVAVVTPKKK
jgi:hypothetical protein